MRRSLHLISLCILAAITTPLLAQAPRTISHQGLLTDDTGTPVADAVRSMTFKIYDVENGGVAIWTETQDVETTNGIFNVVLGSDNPIDGVGFNQDLWLGVTVAGDSEITPRTELTSVPYSFGLVMPLEDSLWIRTNDFLTDGSETLNEELTIHATDAQIGLYSNPFGVGGSGIQLGEIFSSALVDKWAMYRTAGVSESALRFSYGSNADYAANPTIVEISENGGIEASSFDYPDPGSVRNLSINATAFKPPTGSSSVDYSAGFTQAYITAGGNNLIAPLFLPDGAVLDTLDCYLYDNSTADLNCQIHGGLILGDDIGGISVASPASTSGTPGATKVSASLGGWTVNNSTTSLGVEIVPSGGSWAGEGSDLRVKMVVIKYHVLEAG